jgi:uncharacterized protein involved in propanediol utilization
MDNLSNNLESALGHGSLPQAGLFRPGGDPLVARHYAPPLSTRTGFSIAQYGELLQGQMDDGTGSRRRFLISLPCDVLYSRATFAPAPDGGLKVNPSHKTKVKTVVDLTLRYLEHSPLDGTITVESNIEEGKGCGSSTADCVAAVQSVAGYLGHSLEEEEVARLVVDAEEASDNFMFRRAVLFAHREGEVLEDLGPRLPRMEVLGIDTDEEGVVFTLDFPPAVYTWRQIQGFHTLVAALRRAIACRDVFLLGRVATASAVINQQFLPKPMFEEIRRLAECASALGVAVAHSGTVMSVLLDRSDPSLETKVEQLQREFELLGIKRTLRFRT